LTLRLDLVPTPGSTSIEVRRVRTYCLIQQENYGEALKEIDRGIPRKLACFDKAYCFYKLDRHKEALRIIQAKEVMNTQVPRDAWMKLKAQLVRKSSV
jgi:hypothetical protein